MNSLQKLLEIMQALRTPDTGCPWDQEQTFQSLIPFTLEEAHEVADAIERNDIDDLKSELGDLLFQIVFYSQIAKEQQLFEFNDVVEAISEKLTRRHPHVFSNAKVINAEQQTIEWEKIKQQERKLKSAKTGTVLSILDDVSRTLPSITRAEKLQKRAARDGFDWPDVNGVMDKIKEELAEVKQELEVDEQLKERIEDEIGDLFFSCINLSRHAGVNAELCLRKANSKFERRFRALEKIAQAKNLQINALSSDELEILWQEVKLSESDAPN